MAIAIGDSLKRPSTAVKSAQLVGGYKMRPSRSILRVCQQNPMYRLGDRFEHKRIACCGCGC